MSSHSRIKKISVWCAVSWTRIIGPMFFWQDCQHGRLYEHFSSSRTGRHATLLGYPCSEFMTSSLRNKRLAKICGRHVLLTLQLATFYSGDIWKVRYTNQIRTRYRNWRITSAMQLQPSKALFYIGYTSTWLDVRSCVLMQEATTFSIFYDGLSFQHLATVLISVFTLSYGTGLLFRGPFCIIVIRKRSPSRIRKIEMLNTVLPHILAVRFILFAETYRNFI